MTVLLRFIIRVANKSRREVRAAALLLVLFIASVSSPAADFPQAVITNGHVTAKMYLPDAKNGYYRSTRFDWSGAVYSLQFEGHEGLMFQILDERPDYYLGLFANKLKGWVRKSAVLEIETS